MKALICLLCVATSSLGQEIINKYEKTSEYNDNATREARQIGFGLPGFRGAPQIPPISPTDIGSPLPGQGSVPVTPGFGNGPSSISPFPPTPPGFPVPGGVQSPVQPFNPISGPTGFGAGPTPPGFGPPTGSSGFGPGPTPPGFGPPFSQLGGLPGFPPGQAPPGFGIGPSPTGFAAGPTPPGFGSPFGPIAGASGFGPSPSPLGFGPPFSPMAGPLGFGPGTTQPGIGTPFSPASGFPGFGPPPPGLVSPPGTGGFGLPLSGPGQGPMPPVPGFGLPSGVGLPQQGLGFGPSQSFQGFSQASFSAGPLGPGPLSSPFGNPLGSVGSTQFLANTRPFGPGFFGIQNNAMGSQFAQSFGGGFPPFPVAMPGMAGLGPASLSGLMPFPSNSLNGFQAPGMSPFGINAPFGGGLRPNFGNPGSFGVLNSPFPSPLTPFPGISPGGSSPLMGSFRPTTPASTFLL